MPEADSIKITIDSIEGKKAVVVDNASISVTTDFPVVIRPLRSKEKRWVNKRDEIDTVSNDLSELVFLQYQNDISPSFKITAKTDGYIYCFGGHFIDNDEKKSNVVNMGQKITGAGLNAYHTTSDGSVYRIKINKGETMELCNKNLTIAAKEISLK